MTEVCPIRESHPVAAVIGSGRACDTRWSNQSQSEESSAGGRRGEGGGERSFSRRRGSGVVCGFSESLGSQPVEWKVPHVLVLVPSPVKWGA